MPRQRRAPVIFPGERQDKRIEIYFNHEQRRTEEAVEPQVRVRSCESHLVFRENSGHQSAASPVRLVRDFFIHTFNVIILPVSRQQ
jgi:hypothetical protein